MGIGAMQMWKLKKGFYGKSWLSIAGGNLTKHTTNNQHRQTGVVHHVHHSIFPLMG